MATISMKKLAELANLQLSATEVPCYQQALSSLLVLAEEIVSINTSCIPPAAHAFDCVQRLRVDEVTENNQAKLYHDIAPQMAEGLYMVPPVIE